MDESSVKGPESLRDEIYEVSVDAVSGYSETNQERIRLISDHYQFLAFEQLHPGRNIVLGSRSDRQCRFCGRSEPDTRFKNVAHAIPELVGNKSLLSYWECDTCNQKFAALDDHFSKFTLPGRVLAQTHGKRGVPSLKWHKSRIDLQPEKGFQIRSYEDDPIFEIDEAENELRFKGVLQPYRPRSVYKCLCKMALSILPESELSHFRETLAWICLEPEQDLLDTESLICFRWFVPGPRPLPYPTVVLGQRKDDSASFPYVFFFLAFDNYAFQIHLPLCSRDRHLEGKKASVILFPDPFQEDREFGPVIRERLNLSRNEVVRDQEWTFALKYRSMSLREP